MKQLHTELKVHDKAQMALKKLKSDGMDKEGLREAEIRKQFNGIMFAYGLAQASQIKEDHAKLPTNVSLVQKISSSGFSDISDFELSAPMDRILIGR